MEAESARKAKTAAGPSSSPAPRAKLPPAPAPAAARQVAHSATRTLPRDEPAAQLSVAAATRAAAAAEAVAAARLKPSAAEGAAQFGEARASVAAVRASPLATAPPATRDALADDILRHAHAAATSSSSASEDEGEEVGVAAAAAAAPVPRKRAPRAKKAAPADASTSAASSTTAAPTSSDADADDDPSVIPPGARATPAQLAALADDPPGDPPPPAVHVVTTPSDAARVAALLSSLAYRDRVFACDTEVAGIDVARESPCGHGDVIALTLYCGDDAHFGPGVPGENGVTAQPQLFVDSLLGGDSEAGAAVLAAFKPFLEDPSIKKVWHNYSFDRHVLGNAGISVAGFAGDTMHMARLYDSSRGRVRGKGYSLESLSKDPDINPALRPPPPATPGVAGVKRAGGTVAAAMAASSAAAATDADDSLTRSKTSMKTLFGRPNLKKDGTEGKLVIVPPVDVLQTSPTTRGRWITYAAQDAVATLALRDALRDRLLAMPLDPDPAVADATPLGAPGTTLWHLYEAVWRPFGELLTDMEAAGVAVDRPHLAAAQVRAEADREAAKAAFRAWADARVPGAAAMNASSGPQIRQLLFAGVPGDKSGGRRGARAVAASADDDGEGGGVPIERVFKVPNEDGYIEPGKTRAKKQREITLHGVWGPRVPSPLTPAVRTPSGAPAVSTPVLRALAGRPGAAKRALAGDGAVEGVPLDDDLTPPDTPATADDDGAPAPPPSVTAAPASLAHEADALGVGPLYAAFDGGRPGLEACAAVDALVEAAAIDTLLSNFITPLQGPAISSRDPATGGLGRVHCSLNINTETGRLSARRPNLQNQPALEKDRYRVRAAFTAEPDRTLIVADYGQLELRLLAHMANCGSMLDAFKAGGDFHSRTALSMYDYIAADVARGGCVLETGDGGASHDIPLLKDKYGSERRKAKVLNFSIAYGKTAHGLARDFGTSVEEAEDTVRKWYNDRREVEAWQARMRADATAKGYVTTLLGRRRHLPDARARARPRRRRRARTRCARPSTPPSRGRPPTWRRRPWFRSRRIGGWRRRGGGCCCRCTTK